MLTVEQALCLVEQHAQPLAARRIPLGEATGLVLTEDVTSDIDSPPYDKSMMDGYAVASSDRQAVRQVIEEIAAGTVPHRAVSPGTTSRIMTAAPLPDGADAVVPHEQTELLDDGTVRFPEDQVSLGQNVLPLGACMRAGQIVLREGVHLRPVEIGLLAEIGRGALRAIPRPKVAVLPTGNELVSVDERPAVGQIRNSNGPLLLAAVERADASSIDLGVGRDDREDLRERVLQGFEADVLLLSGGVSAGKFDLVPEVLAELEVVQVFHKVSLRPGKPLWFGVKIKQNRQVLVFGLPGDPVSSLVCFEVFVRPALAALGGRGFRQLLSVPARLGEPYAYAGGRECCLPARLERIGGLRPNEAPFAGPFSAEILPWRGSADLAALADANGLVRLAGDARTLPAGTLVEVLIL